MKVAPVLWAVISSLTVSAPTELAYELATRAGGGYTQYLQAWAHLVPDVGETFVDHLDGATVGLDVDLFDHLAGFVQQHQVGGDRADVYAQVGAHLVAVGRELVGLYPVAQQYDAVHGEGVGGLEVGSLALCKPIRVDGDHLDAGLLFGHGESAAYGAHPGVVGRDHEVLFV